MSSLQCNTTDATAQFWRFFFSSHIHTTTQLEKTLQWRFYEQQFTASSSSKHYYLTNFCKKQQ